jgi:PTS system galactitol-specific IIA component
LTNGGVDSPMWTLLDVRNVRVRISCKQDEDVIRLLCQALAEGDYVSPEYEEACVSREREMPTGLPTSPCGIAIPHADPKYTLRPAIAIATLNPKIPFREMGRPDQFVDVGVVCVLAVADPKKQVDLLRRIAIIARDGDTVRRIWEAGDAEEAARVFRGL